uniref:Uncharacterized protein n=1 Tax=Fagus sylvatica TaxID=28930 RepID=A0A2N9G6S7_FAGSY
MSDRGSRSGGHRRSNRLAKGKAVIYAPESSPDTDDEYDAMEDIRTCADASIARNLQAELDAEAAGLVSSAARPPSRPGVVIGRSARPSGTTRPSPQPSVTTGLFTHGFFPTGDNLVCKLKPLSKRVASATTCNSRIVKSSSGQARISIGKRPREVRNIPTASVHKIISCGPRVFLARNKLIHEPGHVGKKTHSCTVRNSRIVKTFPGLAGIFTGKMPSDGPKTLRRPLFAEPYLSAPSSVSHSSETLQERVVQAFRRYQVRRNPTLGARSNTRANTDKKQGKMSQRFCAFFSRTAAFARRVFPTCCKLTRGPRCVGKMTNPATTYNSQFAGSFPRLTGIFTGKARKNSFGTPTSGSHNSLIRTPICIKFIPLESRHRELSEDMLHDPF